MAETCILGSYFEGKLIRPIFALWFKYQQTHNTTHDQNEHPAVMSCHHLIESEKPMEFAIYVHFTKGRCVYGFIHPIHIMR